jgi:DNA polymerase I-like protein with 3'-5' exonuclease and polymerase domains
MRNLPALAKLRTRVAAVAEKGYVPGLDGRRIWVRSQHAALNSLLQGAGAIVMKQALVLFDEALRKSRIQYQFLGNIHDEFQITTPEESALQVGEIGVQCIRDAGVVLNLRCPLDGEYKIGDNWAQTH